MSPWSFKGNNMCNYWLLFFSLLYFYDTQRVRLPEYFDLFTSSRVSVNQHPHFMIVYIFRLFSCMPFVCGKLLLSKDWKLKFLFHACFGPIVFNCVVLYRIWAPLTSADWVLGYLCKDFWFRFKMQQTTAFHKMHARYQTLYTYSI